MTENSRRAFYAILALLVVALLFWALLPKPLSVETAIAEVRSCGRILSVRIHLEFGSGRLVKRGVGRGDR